jgi:hypothetical protein
MRLGRGLFAFIVILLGVGLVPAHADTNQVVIDRLVYSPAEIHAKVGDTIEWVNKDILAHTATVRGDWDVMIAANKSASVALKNAGAMEYHCRFHPNMTGRIVVAPKLARARYLTAAFGGDAVRHNSPDLRKEVIDTVELNDDRWLSASDDNGAAIRVYR